jgi:hypothetical protein
MTPQPDPSAEIVRAAIHPAIGVARMGNSRDAFYVGPQVTEPPPVPPGCMHDGEGALKRQAALFRVYGYDAAGNVVRELTAGDADVRWTVHVANRKAAWYQWQMALDIPDAAEVVLPLRNATVSGAAREGLVIDGGARSIRGPGQSGSKYEFNGQFQGTPVYLGEVRTDDAGRLLFLGGRGVSASPAGMPIYDNTNGDSFINADGWYDDASDGPVTAEVRIGGRAVPVTPAWVVTAPPNYAPEAIAIRTLYDLLQDLYIQAGWIAPAPTTPSFRHDVYPILQRFSNLQWVNAGFAAQFGRGCPHDFDDPAYVRSLSWLPEPGGFDTWAEARLQVFNSFRNADPDETDSNQLPWPWIYGDAMNVPPAKTPRQNAAVSPTQYAILQAWAAGQFVDDWEQPYAPPRAIEDVPVPEQPAMLDRAALHFCLADAFHPGCEVTWPIRHTSMFSAPFRVIHRPPGQPEPDYGPTLTPTVATSPTGPLHAQGPGDLTRWMGLPWQADTGFCRSGYQTTYDPFVPTFWPARVPNQVLTQQAYETVLDASLPREARLAAFNDRALWVRWLDSPTITGQMEQMVEMFGDMGVVELREGVPDDPDFPPVIGVEALGGALAKAEAAPAAPALKTAAGAPAKAAVVLSPADALRHAAARRAGWASPEQAAAAPLPVRHPRRK